MATPGTRKTFLSILGVGLLVAGTLSLGGPAAGLDRGYIGTPSPANQLITKEFPPLLGNYPLPEDSAHPFAGFRPPICRELTYCDAHEFTVTIPEGYREIFQVAITLEWPENSIPERNRVTLHFWPEGEDPVSGRPLGPCLTPRDRPTKTNDDGDEVEDEDHECYAGADSYTFTMTEPDTTHPECTEPDPDLEEQKPDEDKCNEANETRYPFFLTVVNADGANLGYTLKLTFTELHLDFGDFGDPEREFQARPTPPATRPGLSDLFANPELVDDPHADSIVILVPGPDGELIEREFPLLAAGQREPDAGSRVNPFITAGLVIPLLGGLALFLISRRRSEETQ